ncbi:class I adenylate-forming enzyme family protein [Roseospira goensis]|uniref:3-methylmercaptopropionyl-CoA ligase n=1 Tax=Roseospira goensis TaxID=391922 RepID=A0A7W6WLN8_9PROT|nr:AMP-binding protein [Roseospira goensis]MBB4287596.1 acyl-CoA synthetase (AMP-forming)/AMP-acid ligase II [Roseospira goensis]
MNLAMWLHQTGRVHADAPAIRTGERLHATYAEFAFRAWALGEHLKSAYGVGRGDRVALFAKNCAEYLEMLYGVLWIGATVVPINNKLHPREAAWIIENAEATLAITETGTVYGPPDDLGASCAEVGLRADAFARAIAAASASDYRPPVDVRDDDTAWLFYTSGTTGRPKGVMATHRNLRMMATTYALDVDTVSAGDHSLYAAPMSHGAGLYNFQFVRVGGCHVIPDSQGFDPAEIQRLAESLGSLVFFAAPTMVTRLVRHAEASGYDGTGIRTVIYGGGPMYLADITRALEVFGPKFVQIYGQGESPMTITAMPRDLVADRTHPNADARRASVGTAQSCVQVRVVDDALQDVPEGETGEILVRGDTVMKGYWKNEAATAETVVEGWLRTGDLGRLDADGFLTLTDRSKDVIISGGTNIYPREVEEALLTHEDVQEVSVIGRPHPEWGEEVVAFVVLTEGSTCDAAALEAWCRAQIASFKKPKHYVFMPDLPKNSYGKVLKTSLRERITLTTEEA